MAAWIITALKLIVGSGALGAGYSGAEQLWDMGPGEDYPMLSGPGGAVVDMKRGPGGQWFPRKRRHRRRRALTASDRADIAFVAGMISKAAAKDFAVQLAARPR